MTEENYTVLKKHLDVISNLVQDGYKNLEKDKNGTWKGSYWVLFEAVNDAALDAMEYVTNTDGIE